MKITLFCDNAIYCPPQNIGDYFFNFIQGYFSLCSNYQIVQPYFGMEDLKKGQFHVIKKTIHDPHYLNILKIISYFTIALPLIIYVGKVITNQMYTYIDVSHKFLSESQIKLMKKEGSDLHVSELNLDQANANFDQLSLHQIEEWLICFKNKSVESLESKSKGDSTHTNWNRLLNKFLDRSLKEWIDDRHAKGDKICASNRIRRCWQFKTPDLDLSDLDLNTLPSIFFLLEHITVLDCSSNNLRILPESLRGLINLVEIHLEFNKLSKIPWTLGRLKNLKKLVLQGNPLRQIDDLESLSNLHHLNLRECGLTGLPSSIGSFSQLRTLLLSDNHICFLPPEIGKLNLLTELWIDNNALTQLPPQVGNLLRLTELWLNNNKLKFLPNQIGNLSSLNLLSVSGNNLLKLPSSIGQLTNLKHLLIHYNPLLEELPPAVGEIPGILCLNTDGTRIKDEVTTAILESCEFIRKSGILKSLPAKLTRWFKMGKSNLQATDFDKFSKSDKQIIGEWISRLERTDDFLGRQTELTITVSQILESVLHDEEFANLFFIQARFNNENCADRASIAFEELYLAWTVKIQLKNKPFKEQLMTMKKGAKTVALLRHLSKKIDMYSRTNRVTLNESTEIYLYYLIQAKQTQAVDLLSFTQTMKFPEFGSKDWIDQAALFQQVNDTYLEDLHEMLVFDQLLLDEQFKANYKNLVEDLERINCQFHEQSNEHLEKMPLDHNPLSLDFLNWESDYVKISNERKNARIKVIKNTLDKLE